MRTGEVGRLWVLITHSAAISETRRDGAAAQSWESSLSNLPADRPDVFQHLQHCFKKHFHISSEINKMVDSTNNRSDNECESV